VVVAVTTAADSVNVVRTSVSPLPPQSLLENLDRELSIRQAVKATGYDGLPVSAADYTGKWREHTMKSREVYPGSGHQGDQPG